MHTNELILLGKIIKAHGFNGAVVIALEGNFSQKVIEMELVFVEIDKKPVPFFLATAKESSPDSVIVKFDYYDSDVKIKEFVGKNVYSEHDPGLEPEPSGLPVSYIGYTLISGTGNILGRIEKVLSYPMQVMFEIASSKSTPILIPFNEEWILEEDHKNHTIKMELPEGLDSINS